MAFASIVNVIPVTSRKRSRKVYSNEVMIPTGVGGLSRESIALCHQIRTLDKKRLMKKFGEIELPKLQADIIDALIFQLGIYKFGH